MSKTHGSPLRPGRRVDAVFHASVLEQMRQLPAGDLDRLINRWMKSGGLPSPIRLTQAESETLYLLNLGNSQLRLPVLLRVYQRQNRLQVHHVDAFFGTMCRLGAVAGILVTTGGIARDAMRYGTQFCRPLRCISGVEWLSELAVHRTGLGRGRLLCWVLDLQGRFAGSSRRGKGPHVRG